MSKKIGLTTFFDRLDKKINEILGKEKRIIKVKICNRLIEIWTNSEIIEQKCMTQLKGNLIDSNEKPDAIFKSWIDDCSKYFDEEMANSRGYRREEDGCISILPRTAFFCGNFLNNTYYFCCQNGKEENLVFETHILQIMFAQWAVGNELILLHSAAVGIDGKGVLVGGNGGRGKSTLAVSCLKNEFDFVSDDYVMITKKGKVNASPVYSTVGLNRDSYDKLLKGENVIYINEKNGKKLVDISNYVISDELEIKAIILPTKTNLTEPEVVPIDSGAILTKIIITTLNQLAFLHEQQMVKEIALRLNKLPSYEIKLTSDCDKNAKCLEEFIKNNL